MTDPVHKCSGFRSMSPSLLGDVRVEEELLLELERLELGVRLPLLPHAHAACPVVERVSESGSGKEESCGGEKEVRSLDIQVQVLAAQRLK